MRDRRHRGGWVEGRPWRAEELTSPPPLAAPQSHVVLQVAPSPLAGLTWAQIFFIEEVSLHNCSESFESITHRDWSSRFVAFVAGPSAQACDGPGCPGESSVLVGILLLFRASLQARLQGVQNLQFAIVKDARCRLGVVRRGASEHELHGL